MGDDEVVSSWTCARCKFENSDENTNCDVCGKKSAANKNDLSPREAGGYNWSSGGSASNSTQPEITSTLVNEQKFHFGHSIEFAFEGAMEALSIEKPMKINLATKCVGDDGICQLTSMIADNATVTFLDLSATNIEEDGAAGIAGMLHKNRILTTLKLASNAVRNRGAELIAQSCTGNDSLMTLDLAANWITLNGAIALGRMLGTNATLTTLDVSKNDLGGTGVKELVQALESNASLMTLRIARVCMGDYGLEYVTSMLKKNKSLKHLDMKRNRIQHIMSFFQVVASHSNLETLNISDNTFAEGGFRSALEHVLRENTCLKTLDMRGNNNLIQAVCSALTGTSGIEEDAYHGHISSLEIAFPSNALFIKTNEDPHTKQPLGVEMSCKVNYLKQIESILERNRPKMILTVWWESCGVDDFSVTCLNLAGVEERINAERSQPWQTFTGILESKFNAPKLWLMTVAGVPLVDYNGSSSVEEVLGSAQP